MSAAGSAWVPRRLAVALLAFLLPGAAPGVAAEDAVEWTEYVDPDTPMEARWITRRGIRYKLVYSDEFEMDNRTFNDGDDPLWTGLNAPVYSNYQYNYYNSSLAWTEGGKLVLIANNENWYSPYDPDLMRYYQTPMMQTWNKFCFTEGFMELKAQMPARHDVGGLWPAFWLMGNLGRATFKDSTDNVWPFNFDQCPEEKDYEANQFGSQKLHKCDYGVGRGAPEIDIIETMPGNYLYDYQSKIDRGICGPQPADLLRRIRTKQPFVCTSVQAGPGQHKYALERPVLGCVPENYTDVDGTVKLQYYEELYPWADRYGLDDVNTTTPDGPYQPYGTYYDVAINYEFWGDEYYPHGNLMHTDAFSACTMLSETHFSKQHTWQAQWKTGPDGFTFFTLDDNKQFHVPAWSIAKERPMTFKNKAGNPYTNDMSGTMLAREMPREAMYFILNIDMAPRWGWRWCPEYACDCCVDCKRSVCTTCIIYDDQTGEYLNNREWLAEMCAELPARYEIEHIRLYQEEGKEQLTCDPPHLPTHEFIHEHRVFYTPYLEEEYYKEIVYGGQECDPTDPAYCGPHGTCTKVQCASWDANCTETDSHICICEQDWCGPLCRARSVGWGRTCRNLSDHDFAAVPRAEPICTALPFDKYEDLEEIIALQCDRAMNETHTRVNASAGIEACLNVMPGGKYRGCSIRQRANHVLRVWAEEVHGGAECCALLGKMGYCWQRPPEPWWLWVMAVVACCWACVLVPLAHPLMRKRASALGAAAAARARRVSSRAKLRTRARLTRGYSLRPRDKAGLDRLVPTRAGADDPHGNGLRRGFASSSKEGLEPAGAVAAGAPAADAPHDDDPVAAAAAAAAAATQAQAPRRAPESALISGNTPATNLSGEAIDDLAKIFIELENMYGFDPDSVANQHVHLTQMWAATTAAYQDELIGAKKLHDLTFESFERWLDVSSGLHSFERRRHIVFIKYRVPNHAQRLRELALFLCMWGEAGNVRFCPEILCFFFECARQYVPPPPSAEELAVKAEEAAYAAAQARAAEDAAATASPSPSGPLLAVAEAGTSGRASVGSRPPPVIAPPTPNEWRVMEAEPQQRWSARGQHARLSQPAPNQPALSPGGPLWTRSGANAGGMYAIPLPGAGVPSMPPSSSMLANSSGRSSLAQTPHAGRRSARHSGLASARRSVAATSLEAQSLATLRAHTNAYRFARPSMGGERSARPSWGGESILESEDEEEEDEEQSEPFDDDWEHKTKDPLAPTPIPTPKAKRKSTRPAREDEGPRPESRYLREYIRPLYEYFFSYNFKGLSARGAPIERPLEDAETRVNYDDWNEQFWTHERINKIVTHDGRAIIQLPKEERWEALRHVDWKASLAGCKRHNEIHAWWNLLGGFARIITYHVASFYMLLLVALQLYVPDGEWMKPTDSAPIFAGLLAPGLVQIVADGAKMRLKPGATIWQTLLQPDKALPYLLQLGLFAVFLAYPKNETVRTLFVVHSAAVVLRTTFNPGTFMRRAREFDNNVYMPQYAGAAVVLFWLVVFGLKGMIELVVVIRGVAIATLRLDLYRPIGRIIADPSLPPQLAAAPELLTRSMQQLVVWISGMLVYLSSTYHWYIVGCVIFGTLRGLSILYFQGPRKSASQVPLRRMADLPAAFVAQVFPTDGKARPQPMRALLYPTMHPIIERKWALLWNAVIASMFETDILTVEEARELSYENVHSAAQPLHRPPIFERRGRARMPRAPEAVRRFGFLRASLKMRMPAAATVETMPSFSVLIPHYGETIINSVAELLTIDDASRAAGQQQPLLGLLLEYYPDELRCFRERVGERTWSVLWRQVAASAAGNSEADAKAAADAPPPEIDDDGADEEERRAAMLELRKWSSMRTQSLYRTVRGMMLYERALDLLLSVQRPDLGAAEREDIIATKFQCVVSMQRYFHFDAEFLEATEVMFQEFPRLNVAYIEEEVDTSVPQGKVFYSCLIDGHCEKLPGNKRLPRYRVRLPGHPILGDGKGDNQNHAIIYVRGRLLQTIDANQDGYLEEMLKIVNGLAEFGDDPTNSRARVSIVGWREHVYSSLGTIGNFSATSEYVFGSMIQRTSDRPLLSRMYYGHPDIMEKLTMMAQGGVSKATKALNLSEDIFAGMDLCLRGNNVIHREYFQVGKGREMSFGGQLKFISKLSRGTAEMCLTRQSYRLGSRLPFARMLGFFYGHVGFYGTPALMEITIWTLIFILLYFSLVDMAFTPEGTDPLLTYSSISAELIDGQFGPITALFIIGQALPLLFEITINTQNPLLGVLALVRQLCSFSWMFFAFQAQLIGYNYRSEISQGGAQYIATGRGIATTRQHYHALYKGYAHSNLQPGADLIFMAALFVYTRPPKWPGWPFWGALFLIVAAWVLSPSLFNARMFRPLDILRQDVVGWWRWLFDAKADGWRAWHEGTLASMAGRPYAVFITPGRRLLAAIAVLGIYHRLPRGPLELLDLISNFLPVLPLAVGALAAVLLRSACGRAKPERVAAGQVPLMVAPVIIACHAAQLALLGTYDGLWSAMIGRRSAVVEKAIFTSFVAKYFALHSACSALAWFVSGPKAAAPADAEARAAEARSHRAWRITREAGRDVLLSYWLMVDGAIGLLILIPCLLFACVPLIDTVHMYLLFHVRPRIDFLRRAEKVVQRGRSDSVAATDEAGSERSSLNPSPEGSPTGSPRRSQRQSTRQSAGQSLRQSIRQSIGRRRVSSRSAAGDTAEPSPPPGSARPSTRTSFARGARRSGMGVSFEPGSGSLADRFASAGTPASRPRTSRNSRASERLSAANTPTGRTSRPGGFFAAPGSSTLRGRFSGAGPGHTSTANSGRPSESPAFLLLGRRSVSNSPGASPAGLRPAEDGGPSPTARERFAAAGLDDVDISMPSTPAFGEQRLAPRFLLTSELGGEVELLPMRSPSASASLTPPPSCSASMPPSGNASGQAAPRRGSALASMPPSGNGSGQATSRRGSAALGSPTQSHASPASTGKRVSIAPDTRLPPELDSESTEPSRPGSRRGSVHSSAPDSGIARVRLGSAGLTELEVVQRRFERQQQQQRLRNIFHNAYESSKAHDAPIGPLGMPQRPSSKPQSRKNSGVFQYTPLFPNANEAQEGEWKDSSASASEAAHSAAGSALNLSALGGSTAEAMRVAASNGGADGGSASSARVSSHTAAGGVSACDRPASASDATAANTAANVRAGGSGIGLERDRHGSLTLPPPDPPARRRGSTDRGDTGDAVDDDPAASSAAASPGGRSDKDLRV